MSRAGRINVRDAVGPLGEQPGDVTASGAGLVAALASTGVGRARRTGVSTTWSAMLGGAEAQRAQRVGDRRARSASVSGAPARRGRHQAGEQRPPDARATRRSGRARRQCRPARRNPPRRRRPAAVTPGRVRRDRRSAPFASVAERRPARRAAARAPAARSTAATVPNPLAVGSAPAEHRGERPARRAAATNCADRHPAADSARCAAGPRPATTVRSRQRAGVGDNPVAVGQLELGAPASSGPQTPILSIADTGDGSSASRSHGQEVDGRGGCPGSGGARSASRTAPPRPRCRPAARSPGRPGRHRRRAPEVPAGTAVPAARRRRSRDGLGDVAAGHRAEAGGGRRRPVAAASSRLPAASGPTSGRCSAARSDGRGREHRCVVRRRRARRSGPGRRRAAARRRAIRSAPSTRSALADGGSAVRPDLDHACGAGIAGSTRREAPASPVLITETESRSAAPTVTVPLHRLDGRAHTAVGRRRPAGRGRGPCAGRW